MPWPGGSFGRNTSEKRGNALEKDRQRERIRERDDACMWGSEKGKTQVDGYMMTYR